MRKLILVLVLFALTSSALGFLHNIIGTPFLYNPVRYVVNPSEVAENAKTYQRIYGYRGAKFLGQLNQENVEHNPKLYDVEDSTKGYPLGFF